MPISAEAPWLNYYGAIPRTLNYPRLTIYQLVAQTARECPDLPAYESMGRRTSYRDFLARIDRAALALYTAGIRAGDRVTICMPNTPQALDCFYALNRIGAVSNMIHPLSAEEEIRFYLDVSGSQAILTLDRFYGKVAAAAARAKRKPKLWIARLQPELKPLMRLGYNLTQGRKTPKLPQEGCTLWTDLLRKAAGTLPSDDGQCDTCASILYSGGTTGTTKGICLSSYNFNALALQTIAASGYESIRGCTMLSVMPVFHGFGLGIGIHTALVGGACCILVPNFNIRTYADLLRKKHPNFIPGVPTLFEALLRTTGLEKLDMSFLMGVFSGGDSLSVELKHKVDAFLRAHNVVPGMIDGKRVEKNARMMKTAMTMLTRFRKVLAALTLNPARALEELNSDWTASQEIADRLMRDHGLPFRIGHHMASRMVGWARANNVLPLEFPYAQMRRIYREEVSEEYPAGPAELPMSEEEFRAALDPRSIVAARRTAGSASPAEVRKMLEADAGRLAALRAEREAEEARVAKALEDLDEAFRKLL